MFALDIKGTYASQELRYRNPSRNLLHPSWNWFRGLNGSQEKQHFFLFLPIRV